MTKNSRRSTIAAITLAATLALLSGCIPTVTPAQEPAPGTSEPGRLVTEGVEQEDVVVDIVVQTTAEAGGSVFYSTFLNQDLTSSRIDFVGEWVDDKTYFADPNTATFNVIADAALLPGETLSCEMSVNGVLVDSAEVEGGRFFQQGIVNCLYDAADLD